MAGAQRVLVGPRLMVCSRNKSRTARDPPDVNWVGATAQEEKGRGQGDSQERKRLEKGLKDLGDVLGSTEGGVFIATS